MWPENTHAVVSTPQCQSLNIRTLKVFIADLLYCITHMLILLCQFPYRYPSSSCLMLPLQTHMEATHCVTVFVCLVLLLQAVNREPCAAPWAPNIPAAPASPTCSSTTSGWPVDMKPACCPWRKTWPCGSPIFSVSKAGHIWLRTGNPARCCCRFIQNTLLEIAWLWKMSLHSTLIEVVLM